MMKYCKNSDCRIQFNDTSEDNTEEYCLGCTEKMKKKQPKRNDWSNIAIKFYVKKKLITLQNSILSKKDRKVGFSDIIENALKIAEKDGNLSDNIIKRMEL